MPGTHDYQAAREIVVTTTGNIDNLDISGVSLLIMNNASLSTIRGIKAGYAGKIITIVSVGAGQVDLAHQNTNSSAANRLINFVTSSATPLAAGKGTATYQYDATTARWRLVNYEIGSWISVAYSSSNFTSAGAMTWTVDSADQVTYQYMLIGRRLFLDIYLNDTSIGGVPASQIFVAIPGGFTSAGGIAQVACTMFDNGVFAIGFVRTGFVNNTTVEIARGDLAALTASANNTFIRAVASFPVT